MPPSRRRRGSASASSPRWRRSSRSEPARLTARDRRVFVEDDEDSGVSFARGGRARREHARRARLPGLLCAAQARRQVQGRWRGAVAVLLVLGLRRRGGRGRRHGPGEADGDLDGPRRRPRAEPAPRRGAGRGLDLHGPGRGPDGGAGLQEGRAQDPVDAGIQEPDHARDAGDPHHPRRDRRPGRPVRRQGSGAGAAPADHPRGGQRRSTMPSACGSTRPRSRRTRW